ncbi:VWA domain-containing protein [Candidatus Thiosymbion oneisti]|uniref:VWA domain-containing protein n=1 Tax=Candidatus Thiosymbion oneisti TaxID=589554 RepID=UPI0034E24733
MSENTRMSGGTRQIRNSASSGEVEAFLRQVAKTPVPAVGGRGRLIFAMDATASRKPTWDRAARIQAAMFNESAELGGLEIQLCYYSGVLGFECSPWYQEASALHTCMTGVSCTAGLSQIGRVLRHAEEESRRGRVNALVFVGDCVEENPDELAGLAGRLGLLGLPAFVFQEGADPGAEQSFRRIAHLSGGAYCHFDAHSPQTLRDLLSAVAVYAAGGRTALEDFGNQRGGEALRLARQIIKA